MQNIWLEPLVQAYKDYFGSAPVGLVVDVGTRDGDDAEYLRLALGAKSVIAIDANPIAVAKTRKAYPTFDVYETAISDFIGTTDFVQIVSDDKNLAGCSSMNYGKEDAEHVFQKSNHMKIEVPVMRLDTLLSGRDVIDVIKIDIEGYTYQALVGLGELILKTKILHLETETDALFSEHKNSVEVSEYMQSKGFVLVDVSYEWGFGIQDQVWINPLLTVDDE